MRTRCGRGARRTAWVSAATGTCARWRAGWGIRLPGGCWEAGGGGGPCPNKHRSGGRGKGEATTTGRTAKSPTRPYPAERTPHGAPGIGPADHGLLRDDHSCGPPPPDRRFCSPYIVGALILTLPAGSLHPSASFLARGTVSPMGPTAGTGPPTSSPGLVTDRAIFLARTASFDTGDSRLVTPKLYPAAPQGVFATMNAGCLAGSPHPDARNGRKPAAHPHPDALDPYPVTVHSEPDTVHRHPCGKLLIRMRCTIIRRHRNRRCSRRPTSWMRPQSRRLQDRAWNPRMTPDETRVEITNRPAPRMRTRFTIGFRRARRILPRVTTIFPQPRMLFLRLQRRRLQFTMSCLHVRISRRRLPMLRTRSRRFQTRCTSCRTR